jgi:superfamily II DNA or RNA helicase
MRPNESPTTVCTSESTMTEQQFPIGRRIQLPGHFADPVVLESVRALSDGFECRVRLSDGTPDEAILSTGEANALFGVQTEAPVSCQPASAESIRLLVESARIRLAYTHDKHFAVSLSGIRTLPHQIEAVYLRMLPQPRLRFLLADDPGAGKTIMTGLFTKEMRLREAIDRVLILCPAPLTIQWQDEMLRWFGESFDIIFSAVDQQQLVNPWQRSTQVIASLDYAKQDDVRERVWSQRWDLVIIDEAHKCSAYTKSSSGRGDETEKTKRYQLAERLAANTDHLLLLTATPHHGDDDRFAHFIRLIDSDLFPEPSRIGQKATEIRRDILRLGPECPWALRRLKEDLRDLQGRRLFPDRHAHTVTFKLNSQEYDLYKAVTAYINQYLPQASGRRGASVALARTVLQRRLASSTMAIYESIRRRLEKQQDLLKELEDLPPGQRARRLAQLQGRLADAEQEEDDLDDAERDRLADQFTSAAGLDQLRAEVAALQELLAQARRVRDHAADSKLAALKACLERAEFRELSDGRGKLLIFTEHRDTLNYLCEQLGRWGYTTCQIHGGMNPHERKRAQEQFRVEKQICVATEAAGEGINLQFCRLMINYDLPWNPTRLEQRLGRIHRIGQERDVHAFNFVAGESEEGQPIVEGRILERLLEKLEQMRAVLDDRVFDVIGEVLSLNDVNLPDILREAALDPRRLDDYLDQIARIDAAKLKKYEEATGIALARANVDFSGFQQANAESEERRLMPRYVEEHFIKASAAVGLRVEPRADGLWRIEHVLADLRSDRLQAVRRLGKPDPSYRKLTFHKEHLDLDQHLDAVLAGPGHPLYAVVDERLNELLAPLVGGIAVYIDENCDAPYRLHLFEVAIRGQNSKGEQQTLHGEMVAVREELSGPTTGPGRFSIVPAEYLYNLPPHPHPTQSLPVFDPAAAADHIKVTYQMELRGRCQEERRHFVDICRDYLTRSFEARTRAAQDRVMALRAREASQPEVAIARQRAENELTDIQRTRRERLAGLDRLTLVKHGPVRHVASALVLPLGAEADPALFLRFGIDTDPESRRQKELAAEKITVEDLVAEGFPRELIQRVAHEKLLGFDYRAQRVADPQLGVMEVRRIEVKGYTFGNPIQLEPSEWNKAQQLGDTYWLYVVWNPLDADARLLKIQNPFQVLEHAAKTRDFIRRYEIPAQAIEAAAQTQPKAT